MYPRYEHDFSENNLISNKITYKYNRELYIWKSINESFFRYVKMDIPNTIASESGGTLHTVYEHKEGVESYSLRGKTQASLYDVLKTPTQAWSAPLNNRTI